MTAKRTNAAMKDNSGPSSLYMLRIGTKIVVNNLWAPEVKTSAMPDWLDTGFSVAFWISKLRFGWKKMSSSRSDEVA